MLSPRKHLWGDDSSIYFLYGQLLDGLVESGWEKGFEVGAWRAELQFFVREQCQVERLSTRKRPDLGNIVAYLWQQIGIQSSGPLFRLCSVFFKMNFLVTSEHLYCCRCSNWSPCISETQLRTCPTLVLIRKELPLTVDWLNRQLPGCRVFCVQPDIRSAISSLIMELVCLHLPSVLLGISVRNRQKSRGRLRCLRCMRPLLSIWRRHVMLLL